MNSENGIMLLDGPSVRSLLKGSEREVIEVVGNAYTDYAFCESCLPHSVFLHFPDQPRDRIIALPAYLGGEQNIVGIKWVSSFPSNITCGRDRASAVLILNDPVTGCPQALLEASSINAVRTAASAAIAAKLLSTESEQTACCIVGCGLIGYEIVRYLRCVFPLMNNFVLFDQNPERSRYFCDRLRQMDQTMCVQVESTVESALGKSKLIAFATTAGEPWVNDTSLFAPDSTVLHISLRDLHPDVLLSAWNVVDDIDHVCRERTSVHLTELEQGSRDFIDMEISELIGECRYYARKADKPVVFSPFGLGVLDLAVGNWLMQKARLTGVGQLHENFFPDPWYTSNGEDS